VLTPWPTERPDKRFNELWRSPKIRGSNGDRLRLLDFNNAIDFVFSFSRIAKNANEKFFALSLLPEIFFANRAIF
jgi:hypothetical protein